jgi:hypothetical protein
MDDGINGLLTFIGLIIGAFGAFIVILMLIALDDK